MVRELVVHLISRYRTAYIGPKVLLTERRSQLNVPTTAFGAAHAAFNSRHLLRPGALLAEHRDLQGVEHGNAPTLQAIDPQCIAMAREIRDRVEALRAHGLRRTDQISAEIAVMRAANADMMSGSIMSTATSESDHSLSSLFVPSRKGR